MFATTEPRIQYLQLKFGAAETESVFFLWCYLYQIELNFKGHKRSQKKCVPRVHHSSPSPRNINIQSQYPCLYGSVVVVVVHVCSKVLYLVVL